MTEPRPVALISGGTRGIGRAVVLRLAADGYDVSFCYHSSQEAAEVLAKEAEALGVRALHQRVDVADPAAVRGWVERTETDLGPVETAVTSAGITRDKALVMMSDDEWRSVLATNLDGVFHVCRAAAFPMMKRRRGSLVNISSVAGVYGNATQTNYAASKAGIIGFSKSLAKEIGRYGIRVNVVAPGFVDTDMVAAVPERLRAEALAGVALGRMGTADEVADLVAFLAGPRAAYMTGSVVQIDGGIAL
ncbi:3-oxoacyl-[acyl-carrier-protein] reductase [Streptomyces sp. NBRC 14336]|uniref:3-oxoacyl-ACP reductase FabG n=1 Tax=Streptomyces sp. NBRC 14336 TaxID=3030992 RepID=UPI0024A08BDF|nr:3-oxoacyl-ACP reductase FabG [Streptomyces sp. NBRC 14336]WBO80867.1 3-oxoacyl-ACP reductase FabG [Streptomyces sp. SBE_14.2]GLW48125.1 3-oxoacyl-[acyl-carrier-protein] reductase [Streptomyces sp. NBRC 14336]